MKTGTHLISLTSVSFRQLSHGASTWLGFKGDDQDDSTNIWLQRRAAFHGSSVLMGRGVSKVCKDRLDIPDESAAPTPTPIDPYHKPGEDFHQSLPN